MKNFIFSGPFGPIECLVEPSKYPSDAVLVMAHGFRGSREGGGRAIGIARQCIPWCDVVRFNFSGVQIMSKQVAELRSVVSEVRHHKKGARVLLLGRSLGGAASIITAAMDRDIVALILWAAPNDLRSTFRHVMPLKDYERLDRGETLHVVDERGECTLTPDFLTDFDQYNLSALLASWDNRPVLLLHCDADGMVPVENAKRNASILGTSGELHIFKGGDHSFTVYSEQAGEIIADWLSRKLV